MTGYRRFPTYKSKYNNEWGEWSKSLLDFLDGISPALFLNKIDLIIDDDWIWYERRE